MKTGINPRQRLATQFPMAWMRRGRGMSHRCAQVMLRQRAAARLKRVCSAVMWHARAHVRMRWRVTPWLRQRTTLGTWVGPGRCCRLGIERGWMLGWVTGLRIASVLVLRCGCTVRPGHGWVLGLGYMSLSRRADMEDMSCCHFHLRTGSQLNKLE
uniref:Uncharacterized protein n=2 Tax=Triticum urartu TaxID=4572 RepID=A0A8R7PQW1_TRIUA